MERLLDLIKRRSVPGVLIFGQGGLIYSNREAFEMIANRDRIYTGGKFDLPARIYALCEDVKRISDAARTERKLEAVMETDAGHLCSLQAFFLKADTETDEAGIMVLVERIVENHSVDLEKARRDYKLSKKELEVVNLLGQGVTNSEIGEKMFISEHTVKGHLKNIMRKMDVSCRSEVLASLM